MEESKQNNEQQENQNEESVQNNNNNNQIQQQIDLQDITEQILNNELKDILKSMNSATTQKSDLETRFFQVCQKAQAFYKDDLAYPIARFYFEYASFTLGKLEESSDIFGELFKKEKQLEPIKEIDQNCEIQSKDPQQIKQVSASKDSKNIIYEDTNTKIVDETNEQQNQIQDNSQEQICQNEEIQLKNIQEEQDDELNNQPNEDEGEKQEQGNQEQQTENNHKDQVEQDLEIIWDNLQSALTIAEKKYNQLNSDPQCPQEEMFQVIQFLSRVCLRLGELENWREQYDQALEYMHKSLSLREQSDDRQFSRDLCEIYFVLANTYLYKKEIDEQSAIMYYVRSIQILENNLSKELNIPIKYLPPFSQIKISDIQREHLNQSFLDKETSTELKSILKTVYDKLEDTIMQLSEKQKFQEEQNKAKQMKIESNSFKPVSNLDQPCRQITIKRKALNQEEFNQSNNQQNKDNKENNNNTNLQQNSEDNKKFQVSEQLQDIQQTHSNQQFDAKQQENIILKKPDEKRLSEH